MFNLDTYVEYLKDFHAFLGPKVHVMAVCQPCIPVLMATALMAEEKVSYQPQSMILMGGPVDTRINPTKINQITLNLPMQWFERYMVSEIPNYALGAGRKVTPGNLILGGFIQMNVWTHIKKHYEHILNVANNDIKAVEAHRTFYDEYLSVMDLPAEYFLQTVDKVFKQHLLARNEMDYKGHKLNFKAIKSTALMTIEGENDDITGLGQTYAAHAVCSDIPESKREHFLRLDVGHYGIFSGSRWRKDIYPQIRNFIKKHSN
jgi:poly(3-hydroxybutyrate) depolymerase